MTKFVFSSSTKWPTKNKLPLGFDPCDILQKTTTCGEDIKRLHQQGITGEGIKIAVIDSGFVGEKHKEFENAKLTKCTLPLKDNDIEYHFHMEDVLSKICGKNLGSAPDVEILYYECQTSNDDSYVVREILKDILKRVQEGEEIKVVSCSFSLTNYDDPFMFEKDCFDLVEKLKHNKCEVVDSSWFGQHFCCCHTTFTNAQNDIDKYQTATFVKEKKAIERIKKLPNIICGGRVLPEHCSKDGYKYEVIDCFSWTIPTFVGYYALALQINPKLSLENFTELCNKSCDISSSGLNVLNMTKVIGFIKENKTQKTKEKL